MSPIRALLPTIRLRMDGQSNELQEHQAQSVVRKDEHYKHFHLEAAHLTFNIDVRKLIMLFFDQYCPSLSRQAFKTKVRETSTKPLLFRHFSFVRRFDENSML